jgi:hypothetical protein
MKFLFKTLLIFSFGYLAGLYLPFWSLIITAFIVSAVIRTSLPSSFIAGFIAIFALWFFQAFLIDQETNSILTNRVAPIFSMSNIGLILVTGLVGGLTGAFGATSGTLFTNMIRRKKRKNKYY